MKERHIIEAFEAAGITSPDRARPLDDVPVDGGGFLMDRLRQRGVIREASPGLYYVDLDAWRAQRRTRRMVALLVVGIALAIAGIATGVRSAYHLGERSHARADSAAVDVPTHRAP